MQRTDLGKDRRVLWKDLEMLSALCIQVKTEMAIIRCDVWLVFLQQYDAKFGQIVQALKEACQY